MLVNNRILKLVQDRKKGIFSSNTKELFKNENINILSEDRKTFPYLLAIETVTTFSSIFIDNIDKLDINNKNKYGKTALMALSEKGLIYYVKKLLEAGADWTMKDKNGKIARDYAESYSKETDINKLEDGEDNDPAIYYLLKEWEETH